MRAVSAGRRAAVRCAAAQAAPSEGLREGMCYAIDRGIHHVALKPQKEQFDKVMEFYTGLLGLEVVRRWGDERYPAR